MSVKLVSKLLSFLILTLMVFSGSRTIYAQTLQTNPGGPEFSVRISGQVIDQALIIVTPGQLIHLTIYASNLENVGGVNIQLRIPTDQVIVKEALESDGVCQVWDKPPQISTEGIEFICVQGKTIQPAGELIELTLQPVENFSNATISVGHFDYIDLAGNLTSGDSIELAKLTDSNHLSVEATSGELQPTKASSAPTSLFSGITIWLAVFMSLAIIVTIFLAFRLIRLNSERHV